MGDLRKRLIRLAHEKPALREHLLPILAKTADLDKEAIRGRFTLSRGEYLPKDNQTLKQIPTDEGLEIWVWEDLHNRSNRMLPFGAAWVGRADKPLWFSAFTSTASQANLIESTIKNHQSKMGEKSKRLQERRDFQHGYQVGDILVASWGYDQTNVDFYQVVGLPSPKDLDLREVALKVVRSEQTADFVVPDIGHFVSPVMRKRPSGHYVRIDSSRRAGKWDGKPEYQTGAMYGH